MKIIMHSPYRWWVQESTACGHCKTIVEFESDDPRMYDTEKILWECPCCHGLNEFRNPNQPPKKP